MLDQSYARQLLAQIHGFMIYFNLSKKNNIEIYINSSEYTLFPHLIHIRDNMDAETLFSNISLTLTFILS